MALEIYGKFYEKTMTSRFITSYAKQPTENDTARNNTDTKQHAKKEKKKNQAYTLTL